MINWVAALKKYNAGKDCWCIPKKGSAGHREVVRLMKREAAPADRTPFWSKFGKRAPAAKKPPKARGRFRDDDYDGVDVSSELAAIKEAKAMGRSLYSLEGRNPFKKAPTASAPKVSPHKGGPILFGVSPKPSPAKLLMVRRK